MYVYGDIQLTGRTVDLFKDGTRQFLNYVVNSAGDAGTVRWTYTVPVGKRFVILCARVLLDNTTNAVSNGTATAEFRIAGAAVLDCVIRSGDAAFKRVAEQLSMSEPIILNAGEVATGFVQHLGTNNTILQVRMLGFEVPA